LIYAVGTAGLFLLGAPSFAPIVAACALGGLMLAPFLRGLTPRPGSDISVAAPLFITGLVATLALAPGFRSAVVGCVVGGTIMAYLLNRARAAQPRLSIRPLSA
jgi:hypothetical protein